MRKRHIVIVSALALGLAGAGAGIASASVPDSSGVIHGCYKPTTNGSLAALGVIDTAGSGGQCPANQTTLTWSQAGPQGPAGAQGPAGPQGATGATGPAGPAGVSGYQLIRQASSCGGALHQLTIPAGDVVLGAGVLGGIGGGSAPDTNDPTKWDFACSGTDSFGNPAPATIWMAVATISS